MIRAQPGKAGELEINARSDLLAATLGYLADARRRLTEIEAGGEPPVGMTRDQRVADLEESILVYRRAVRQLTRP